MIYTIGRTEVYEICFRQATDIHPPKKVGSETSANVRDGYKGGSVWRTEEAAQKAADRQREDYTVYGVKADWKTDVEQTGEDVGRLLNDSELVRL